MTTGISSVDLLDPQLFATNRFGPVLAQLRREDPVHWHDEPDGPGFWVVTRYADVAAAYKDTDTFSSRYGMHLDSNRDAVSAVSQRMLIVSDPPDHTQLKRVLSALFSASRMTQLDGLVRRIVPAVLADALDRGETEFIEVAKRIPNHVICALMELPRDDWDWVGEVTTTAFEGATETERATAHSQIFLYLSDVLAQRRERPGDDLISEIAAAERDSDSGARPLTDEEIVFNANGILAGANETTRYSAAGGVLALAQDEAQWTALRDRTTELSGPAAEETLRWTTPGVHAMRTVLRPARIGDTDLTVGDRVTLWNASANRDETVFAEPDDFRVDRHPNRHLAFGSGPHLCLGARLARLELEVFLADLARRVDRVEVTGEPRYNASNFTWGLRSLPVRLVPARTREPVAMR